MITDPFHHSYIYIYKLKREREREREPFHQFTRTFWIWTHYLIIYHINQHDIMTITLSLHQNTCEKKKKKTE